jgi:hypothetical protein
VVVEPIDPKGAGAEVAAPKEKPKIRKQKIPVGLAAVAPKRLPD